MNMLVIKFTLADIQIFLFCFVYTNIFYTLLTDREYQTSEEERKR